MSLRSTVSVVVVIYSENNNHFGFFNCKINICIYIGSRFSSTESVMFLQRPRIDKPNTGAGVLSFSQVSLSPRVPQVTGGSQPLSVGD